MFLMDAARSLGGNAFYKKLRGFDGVKDIVCTAKFAVHINAATLLDDVSRLDFSQAAHHVGHARLAASTGKLRALGRKALGGLLPKETVQNFVAIQI